MERFFSSTARRSSRESGLKPEEIPVILGEVLFNNDTVILETYDDGRLDRLVDRFTAAAGSNIPPAHPRTKIIGKEQRHLLALSWRWQLPEGLAEEEAERLNNEQIAHIVRDVWPETLPSRRSAGAPRAGSQGRRLRRTALRTAVLQLEETAEGWVDLIDWNAFRAKLNSRPSRRSIPIV